MLDRKQAAVGVCRTGGAGYEASWDQPNDQETQEETMKGLKRGLAGAALAVAGAATLGAGGTASAEREPLFTLGGVPMGVGVTLSDEDADRLGIGDAEAEAPGLGGEWSEVDACAWLTWQVQFLVGDVDAFALQQALRREELRGPAGEVMRGMQRERVRWSFYAAKGIEKAVPVLCAGVPYEQKAAGMVMETLRQAAGSREALEGLQWLFEELREKAGGER